VRSVMRIIDSPAAIFVVSFGGMWLSVLVGVYLSRRLRAMDEHERGYFNIVLTSTLTLLGLIIGFSFSMAAARYDLRKHYEEEEANAIGTEYARSQLLPMTTVPQVRELLKKYLELRISFYEISDWRSDGAHQLADISIRTQELQLQLWSLVQNSAGGGTATLALATAGMNDVLNSQGYAQAAWSNRVPAGAWMLMAAIALWSNMLMGFGSRNVRMFLLLALPGVLSISFFLIADIDSPRNGVIRVHPQNLLSLSESLNAH
jgi:hypothetical protein